jgi:ABC-type lipoprotein release transport system permease subunit
MIFSAGQIVTLFIIPQDANIFSSPRVKQFLVTGISEVGFYEYDKVMAYISITSGQKLFKLPDVVSWTSAFILIFLAIKPLRRAVIPQLG